MTHDILYVSALCSEEMFNYITSLKGKHGHAGGLAGQKFNFLMASGFGANNCSVQTISAIPVSNKNVNKIFWKRKEEMKDGIKYVYCFFINIPIIRQFCLFLSAFFETYIWCKKNPQGIVISYSMNASVSLAAQLVCKLRKNPILGIITDVPGKLAEDKKKVSLFKKIAIEWNLLCIKSYDMFVFLTQQMDALFNPQGKPYIIMEGLVSNIQHNNGAVSVCNNGNKTVMFAGQLSEKYGLKIMVKGFSKTTNPNYRFKIYGTGSYVKEIKEVIKNDNRIMYMGLADNITIVKEEQNVDLLINIRPTDEDYTKYSFPSKNMEYMVSSTPVLTSRLPGMPEEYYPYVYICDDETIEGVAKSIDEVLSKPDKELKEKGRAAREFVLQHKNNVYQTKRIIDFINSQNKK